jgi:hypothetical protein
VTCLLDVHQAAGEKLAEGYTATTDRVKGGLEATKEGARARARAVGAKMSEGYTAAAERVKGGWEATKERASSSSNRKPLTFDSVPPAGFELEEVRRGSQAQ